MALFEPVLQALNEAGVRYVIVGGVAVVLQGHARLTADLDLAVDLSPGEAGRAIDALVGMGLQPTAPVDPTEFAHAATRERWISEKGMLVFSLRDPTDPMRQVDLFTRNPLPFEDLWSRSDVVSIEGLEVRVASISDLIEMKRLAGRPLDRHDIEQLERIERLRRGG